MRAAVLTVSVLRLRSWSDRSRFPGPERLRVRIQACGVCGSDVFLQDGGFGADKLPVVPGHEAAGIVDAVGGGVERFAPGDQVALYYIENDPDAPRPNLGPGVRRMGVDVDGAFAEYVVRPEATLIRPARHVEPATLAVLTDAVGTAYHSLLRVGRPFGERHGRDPGIGGIGSNAVQVAKSVGARVIAISRSEERRALGAAPRRGRGCVARGRQGGDRGARCRRRAPMRAVRADGRGGD